MVTAFADQAERALLGALLMRPDLIGEAGVAAADFNPGYQHPQIFDAVQSTWERSGRSDAQMVLGELLARGDNRVGGSLGVGPYLMGLVESCPVAGNASFYAEAVRGASLRRDVQSIATSLTQATANVTDVDRLREVAAQFAIQLDMRLTPTSAQYITGLESLGELVDAPEIAHDWIIPALLERMDRVILVAPEGAGKSMLARQIVSYVAAGVHPFTPKVRIPAQRTLLVDLENPPGVIRRKTRPMVEHLRSLGVWKEDAEQNAFVWKRPQGLNLRNPADQHLLDQVLTETRPALVAIGPLYKASVDGGDRWDVAASELASVFDRFRAKHRCAWWIEHHMPGENGAGQRPLRSFGSSLWMRWPEFGLAMKRIEDGRFEVVKFRGDRDERRWPDELHRGASLAMPWEPKFNQKTTFELHDEDAL